MNYLVIRLKGVMLSVMNLYTEAGQLGPANSDSKQASAIQGFIQGMMNSGISQFGDP